MPLLPHQFVNLIVQVSNSVLTERSYGRIIMGELKYFFKKCYYEVHDRNHQLNTYDSV